MEQESRSAAHRRAKRLEALGRSLIALPPSELKTAPLSDQLLEAVTAAKAMSRAALKRQTLYIGRLIRELGDEVEAIFDFVEHGERLTREETQRHALIEDWRARLRAEGEAALTELLELHPEADGRQLRQLIRRAALEAEQGKPPAAARKLFASLRSLFAAAD